MEQRAAAAEARVDDLTAAVDESREESLSGMARLLRMCRAAPDAMGDQAALRAAVARVCDVVGREAETLAAAQENPMLLAAILSAGSSDSASGPGGNAGSHSDRAIVDAVVSLQQRLYDAARVQVTAPPPAPTLALPSSFYAATAVDAAAASGQLRTQRYAGIDAPKETQRHSSPAGAHSKMHPEIHRGKCSHFLSALSSSHN